MNQSQDPISVLFLKKYFYCTFVRNTTAFFISVLADMKNIISVIYRYRPIWKLNLSRNLSSFIGIGRYEKKLIGCSRLFQVPTFFGYIFYLCPIFTERLFEKLFLGRNKISYFTTNKMHCMQCEFTLLKIKSKGKTLFLGAFLSNFFARHSRLKMEK